MKKFPLLSLCLCVSVVNFSGCATKNEARVVLYCSVDEVYAKPLIKKLEAKTGLKIDALFDTEATKTAGLANRIRAERGRPRCDVFWSSALLQTLLMSDEGVLETYDSPAARDLPARFRGRDWVSVGARARVVMASGSTFKTKSAVDLADYPANVIGKMPAVAFSNPQFGTASDWVTALTQRKGSQKVLAMFVKFKENEAGVLPGNGDVARAVADCSVSGCGLYYGISDSDDYLAQKREKKPVSLFQTVKDNVLVPGAVSILKGAPNPENAKKLLDAIASEEGERALTSQMPGVFSLRGLDKKSNFQSGGVDFSFLMNAPRDDYSKWAKAWREIREPLHQIFASK